MTAMVLEPANFPCCTVSLCMLSRARQASFSWPLIEHESYSWVRICISEQSWNVSSIDDSERLAMIVNDIGDRAVFASSSVAKMTTPSCPSYVKILQICSWLWLAHSKLHTFSESNITFVYIYPSCVRFVLPPWLPSRIPLDVCSLLYFLSLCAYLLVVLVSKLIIRQFVRYPSGLSLDTLKCCHKLILAFQILIAQYFRSFRSDPRGNMLLVNILLSSPSILTDDIAYYRFSSCCAFYSNRQPPLSNYPLYKRRTCSYFAQNTCVLACGNNICLVLSRTYQSFRVLFQAG